MKNLFLVFSFLFLFCFLFSSCSSDEDWCNQAAIQYWSNCTCFARLYNDDSVSESVCSFIIEQSFCYPDPDDPIWIACYSDLRKPANGCEYILPDSCSLAMGW